MCLTIAGHPPRHKTLYELAQKIRKRRTSGINEDGMQLVEYDDIGKHWVQWFLSRHPELKSLTPRFIDAVRVKHVTPERLQWYFDYLQKVIM